MVSQLRVPMSLKVRGCISILTSGCVSKVTRGTFRTHLEKCDYSPAVCPHGGLNCSDLLKRDLADHLNSCIFRPTMCPKCDSNLLFSQLEDHYANTCIECPSVCEDCKENVLRKQLSEHSKNCPEKILQCSYSPRGCSFTVFHQTEHISNL